MLISKNREKKLIEKDMEDTIIKLSNVVKRINKMHKDMIDGVTKVIVDLPAEFATAEGYAMRLKELGKRLEDMR